jgi:glycerol kinase
MPHVLAIDQSTSATKALLFHDSMRLVDQTSAEHRQIYPRPGFVEHDAAEIWRNVQSVVRQLLDRQPADVRDDLLCLSITNQRETVVVFDRSTGEPLHHAIVWQCRRGEPVCQALREAGHEPLIAGRTGLRIDTYFSGSKLAWLIRNHADIAGRLADGTAVAGTIDAYLVHRLTGGKVFATDVTNASRTLLYDIRRLRWDPALCDLFGVPIGCLPEVRDCTAHFGTTDVGGLLRRPIPICGVMGDSQASLLAHRCVARGMAKVTLGTGSSVLLNIGNAFTPPAGGVVTTVAFAHRGTTAYAFEGVINYSTATLHWLRDQLRLIESPAETEAAARAVPDNGGVYLVPAFAGLGAPHWAADARAALVGLTSHSGRDHVIRAALESIAYQIHDALDMMRRQCGADIQAIHADGGGTRNPFLMQFIADIAHVELRGAPIAECSPAGAVIAGLLGTGIVRSVDDLPDPSDSTVYHPQMPADQVAANLRGWHTAIKQVLAGVA